jgi:hypothetical protein
MKLFLKVLVLVAVAAILIACGVYYMGRLTKEQYEKTQQLWTPAASIRKLSVETSYGEIKIKGDVTADCNVSAKITANAPTTEEAKSLAEQTKITLETKDGVLYIRAQKPEMKKGDSIGISYTVTVPKIINIECKSSYGGIKLTNIIGDVLAGTSYGDIIVETVSGKLQLNTSYGKVDCTQIVSSDFFANSSFGDVFARFSPDCPPDLRARIATSYGDIDADIALNFSGDVFVDTSFGKIKTNVAIVVKGELSKSHLAGTIGRGGKGLLELKTSFGSIKIE